MLLIQPVPLQSFVSVSHVTRLDGNLFFFNAQNQYSEIKEDGSEEREVGCVNYSCP